MRSLCCTTDGNLAFKKDDLCEAGTWKRWDEELVTEFGLWMNLFKKTVVVVAAVSLVCFIVF